MKAKWFINPFERVAGWPALITGLLIMSLTAVSGSIRNIYFDGVLDVHHLHDQNFPLYVVFLMQAIDLLSIFLTVWLAGAIFSESKFRVVDIAGTMALSRAPMLPVTLLGFLPILPRYISDMPEVIIFSLTVLVFGVWMVALMYHAFTVSLHLKGRKGTVVFIGTLFIAEVISKILIIAFLAGSLSITKGTDTGPSEIFVIPEGQNIQQTAAVVITSIQQGDYKTFMNY
jgi:hypothetical protein